MKRARSVGKLIASQPPPFHYSEWVEAEPHRHEIHDLLAPVLVRADGMATVGLMLSCRAWRDALKPQVIAYMKEVNQAFATAQLANYKVTRMGPVDIRTAADEVRREWDGPGPPPTMEELTATEPDHPLTKTKLTQMQERLRKNRDDINQYYELASPCFNRDVPQLSLKISNICCGSSEDPRQAPDAGVGRQIVRAPKPYVLGEATVHAYAAMAMKRCEVCAPLGRKCKSSGGGISFAPTPYAQGATTPYFRLVHASMQCVNAECFCWNTIGLEPLKLRGTQRGYGLAALPGTQHNNRLLECALRHTQLVCPIRAQALSTRMRSEDAPLICKEGIYPAARNLGEEVSGLGPNADDDDDGYAHRILAGSSRAEERCGRVFWLREHPSLPKNFSFQEKLRLTSEHFARAERDMKRSEERQLEIKKAIEQANRVKLTGDIEDLLSNCAGLRAQNIATIDDLENLYPGVRATANRVITTYTEGETEHALDIAFTRSFVRVAEMMASDVRRWDQCFAEGGQLASGPAYTWITGMSIGGTPGVSLSEISNKLNEDPIVLQYDPQMWHTYIKAMHLFDALTWNALTVIKCQPRESGAAGGSNDPLPNAARGVHTEWSIGIGFGEAHLEVRGEVAYPSTRAEWVRQYEAAARRLDELDLEAQLPIVPSQDQINELFDTDDNAKMAINWIEVMAQTLAYFPSTRGMGLDILTNSSTRGVVQAMQTSGFDMEMLGIAKAIKAADGEPME